MDISKRGQKVLSFLKLTRPLFLAGGVILYAIGALSAVLDGASFKLNHLLLGQLLVTTTQLMTHYSNEFFDQASDRVNAARTWFSGGSGMIPLGMVRPSAALRAAWICAGVAVIALIFGSVQVPLLLLPGIISLLAAWFYSAPPLRIVSTGWGELSSSLIVTVFVPVVGYVMQSGGILRASLLIICLPLVLIHIAMLIAFEIPDVPADTASGKRTLTVRIGIDQAIRLHNASLILAFCVILGLFLFHWPGAELIWLSLPLAVWHVLYIRQRAAQDTARFTLLTFGALAIFAITAALWLAGLTIYWLHL
jgi:1,4-dihydroxy-2-naphthoate octaprenyltransferase